MTSAYYSGKRVRPDDVPVNHQLDDASYEEQLLHLRDRQIKAAVRAYELQLRFSYNTCPDMADRYLEEEAEQRELAEALDLAADALIEQQEAAFLEGVGERHV